MAPGGGGGGGMPPGPGGMGGGGGGMAPGRGGAGGGGACPWVADSEGAFVGLTDLSANKTRTHEILGDSIVG